MARDLDMRLPVVGAINGTLERCQEIGDGRKRLTIYTKRFGRFVIAVSPEAHAAIAHPEPIDEEEADEGRS